MKRLFQILFALMTLATFSIASAMGAGYIEAEGVVYAEGGQSPNAMRRMAVMDAYRYLAEQIDTIYVTAEATVKNMRDLDEVVNTKVEAALRGAKVVALNRAPDGSFHAIVRMSMYGEPESLAGAVLKEDVRVETFLKPKFTNIRSEIHYTGLIIDCRGLNISAAIAPAIKSVGGVEVYAYKNVGYQNAVSKGIVEYSSTLEAARAGSKPLVIKAVKVSGACDVVVSDEDADRILAANQTTNILVNCAVVVVR